MVSTFANLGIVLMLFACSALSKRESIANLNECEQCFGFGGGKRIQTPELHEPIPPDQFFKNYVYPTQQPVLMKGLVKDTVAFKNWGNDDYLKSLKAPANKKHRVEINKVQDSSKPIIYMHWLDFMDIYHDLPYYMVDTLPEFMRQDVQVPWCLQCEGMKTDILADLVIWFSSGGTNGYVHTDQVDNLHCVFSGNKYFIIVDPKYIDKIKFDNPVSTSSFIDVNHVGYDTRPELAEVEYYHANVSAGDCIYLPFEWIHQVRSYGETHMALSIWWDYYNNTRLDLDKCNNDKQDEDMTLADFELHPDDHNFHVGTITDGMKRCVIKATEDGLPGLTFKHYAKFTYRELGNALNLIEGVIHQSLPYLKKVYMLMDHDSDGLVTMEEINSMTDKDLLELRNTWLVYQRFVDKLISEYTIDDEWWLDEDVLEHHAESDKKVRPDAEALTGAGKEEL